MNIIEVRVGNRPAISYSADNIVLRKNGDEMELLVVERRYPPFQGEWALPGGFIEDNESPVQASLRELEEETGLKLTEDLAIALSVRQFEERDPRGRVITYPFLFWLADQEVKVVAGDDAKQAVWVKLTELGPLAFDHGAILCEALGKFWSQMAFFNPLLQQAHLPSLFYKKKNSGSVYFGGSFNPWHQGHDQCLKQCSDAVESLDLVVVPDTNPWKDNVEVMGSRCFYQRYLEMVIPNCYTLQGRMDCDFAFIFLSAPLESISPFGLTEQFFPELPLLIAGYPADKVDQMWESTCLATTEGNRLFYDCDTVGGMSGSPILQKQGEQYNLVGIHTRGEEGINSGVLLTSHFSSVLEKAKEELQNGQTSKELTWYANPLLPQNQEPHVTVYIKNDCKESIVAKVLYKDIRGRMTNKMRFIGRKSKKILDKVFGDEVYIYFQTQSGSYTSSGNAMCGQGTSWPNCFVSYPANLDQTEQIITLQCPK